MNSKVCVQVLVCVSCFPLFPALQNAKSAETLIGHMQPIGNQRPIRRGEIDEFDTSIPSSSFYRDYLLPEKPVVLRGAIKYTAAMKNWINDTYMKENYGSITGLVDRRTNWTRGGVETPPRSVMNYSEFIDRLPREKMYWDDKIPSGHKILKNLPIPLSLDCEEIRTTFIYINLMVNSGNVSYVLHSDFADNFFHFFAGAKTWLLANSTFRDSVYMGQGTQSKDMSPVVPDSVDLVKYPRMADVDFHEVVLRPGDILYIPRNWPHYVRSFGRPNIAMNIWFGSKFLLKSFKKSPSCERQIKTADQLFRDRATKWDTEGTPES